MQVEQAAVAVVCVGVVDAYIRHSAKRMICIEPFDRIVYIGRV
jgi:hypothetical protein